MLFNQGPTLSLSLALTYASPSFPAPQLFGIIITLGEAVAYVFAGSYGPIGTLGAGNALLIVFQVCE